MQGMAAWYARDSFLASFWLAMVGQGHLAEFHMIIKFHDQQTSATI